MDSSVYRTMILDSPDPIIVIDEPGIVQVFNLACEKLFGYAMGEIVGSKVAMLYKSNDEARRVGRMLWATPGHRIQNVEAWIKAKDGEIIPISLSAAHLYDQQNNMNGSFSVFKDLREIKRLQEQSYLVAKSPDPTIVIDTKGIVTLFNAACERLFGYSSEDAVGKTIVNFYESERVARSVGKRIWNSPEKRIQNITTQTRAKDGEIIPVILSASVIFNEKGERTGTLGVFKDLRETIKRQEKDQWVAMGKIAQRIGHDLFNDIFIMTEYIQGLESLCDKDGNAALLQRYVSMRNALLEAADKLRNMLRLGKPTELHKKWYPVSTILGVIEDQIKRYLNVRNISYILQRPDSDFEIFVDRDQVEGVFYNLLMNSIAAIKEKRAILGNDYADAMIQVSALKSEDSLEVAWRDNGIGIPDHDRPRIFDSLFTTRQSSEGGLGLGLYLTKETIENHGGEIAIEDESDGALFRVRIPVGR